MSVLGAAPVSPDVVARSLDQRLGAAAAVLRPDLDLTDGEPGHVAARFLSELLAAVETRPGPSAWLLLTALTGSFAGAPDVEWLARRLELDPLDEVAFDLLDRVRPGVTGAAPDVEAELVGDRVVIDVARSTDLAAALVARWSTDHPILEVTRRPYDAAFFTTGEPRRLVIPWQTTVLLVEPPDVSAEWQIPSAAQYSGNRVGVIGHDLAPILATRGHTMGPARRFARYLAEIKHAAVIAARDEVGARGFAGFGEMLAAQGLAGPSVAVLPDDPNAAWSMLVDGEFR